MRKSVLHKSDRFHAGKLRLQTAVIDALEHRLFFSTTVAVNAYLNPNQNQTFPGAGALAGREVFVDLNGDGVLQTNEPHAITGSDGTAMLSVAGQAGTTFQIGEVLPEGFGATGLIDQTFDVNSPTVVSFGNLAFTAGGSVNPDYTKYGFSNLGSNASVTKAVTQPDGKLLVIGRNGSSTFLARYFPDGEADKNFSSPDGIVTSAPNFSNSTPVGLVVEPSGMIVVITNNSDGPRATGVSAGGAPNSFTWNDGNSSDSATGVALMVDGSILVTGSGNSPFAFDLAQSTGTPVSSFGGNGTGSTTFWSGATNVIATVNASGGFDVVANLNTDTLFGAFTAAGQSIGASPVTVPINDALPVIVANPPDANKPQFIAQAITPQSNGDLLIAGTALCPEANGQTQFESSLSNVQQDRRMVVLARVTSAGVLDSGFASGGVFHVDDESNGGWWQGTETVNAVNVLPNNTADGEILLTETENSTTDGDDGSGQLGPIDDVHLCICREFATNGTELDGYSSGSNSLAIAPDISGASAPLAELSGVLPVASSTASIRGANQPSFTNPSIGFHGVATPVMLTGRAAADLIVEMTRPSTTFISKSQPTITAAGSTVPEILKVRYTDAVGLKIKSLGSGNLTIRRPGGATLNATFLGVDAGGNSQNSVAEYSVLPASGAWGVGDSDLYHVDLLAGQVKNANQTAAAVSDLATFNVSISAVTVTDTTPPAATLGVVLPITTAGSGPLSFGVTYTDNIAVKLLSLGAGNVTVSGPGGTALTVVSASANSLVDAGSITVTYSVAAPAGGWVTADNASYPISLTAGSVTDAAGNPIAASVLGSYVVAVGIPSGTLAAVADVTTAGTGSVTLSVTYTDTAAAIKTSTLGNANLSVSGPDNTTLSITGASAGTPSGNQVVVTYTVAAPSGGFQIANNGLYTVNLASNQVTDVSSNAALAALLGTFTVNIASVVVVNPPVTVIGQTSSTTTLGVPVTSVQSGNIVVFTATVTPGDGGTPTGTFTFSSGSTVLGTAAVVGGSGSFSLASLPGGDNAITAAYSGDATYAASTSEATTVTVTAPPAGAAALSPGLAKVRLPVALVAGAKHAISVPVLISNTGGQLASGIVQLNLYASLDGALDAGDALLALPLRHKLKLKAGKGAYLTIHLKGLPASLGNGTYHLLAQVIDASGFAQTIATSSTVTVAAPFINPVLSFSRVTLASTLVAERGPKARQF